MCSCSSTQRSALSQLPLKLNMPPSPSRSSTLSVLPMDTERTPLLSDGWTVHTQHEALYQRFSPTQKRVLVALVSVSGLLLCRFTSRSTNQPHIFTLIPCKVFISGSFIPSIP
ncbi:hypothetical protein BDQ17DRAFT_1348691 [Cyathus striatus]|nr:hypothetical protein BDQ17DRAFT_1348691 [Cyathus striatus]